MKHCLELGRCIVITEMNRTTSEGRLIVELFVASNRSTLNSGEKQD